VDRPCSEQNLTVVEGRICGQEIEQVTWELTYPEVTTYPGVRNASTGHRIWLPGSLCCGFIRSPMTSRLLSFVGTLVDEVILLVTVNVRVGYYLLAILANRLMSRNSISSCTVERTPITDTSSVKAQGELDAYSRGEPFWGLQGTESWGENCLPVAQGQKRFDEVGSRGPRCRNALCLITRGT